MTVSAAVVVIGAVVTAVGVVISTVSVVAVAVTFVPVVVFDGVGGVDTPRPTATLTPITGHEVESS